MKTLCLALCLIGVFPSYDRALGWYCNVRDCAEKGVFNPKRNFQKCTRTQQEELKDDFFSAWNKFRLPRIDPVKVGYTRQLNIVPGQVHTMRTLSTRPPIFEIEDFFNTVECEMLVRMAESKGLESSRTVWEDFDNDEERMNHVKLRIRNKELTFADTDRDGDGTLDAHEVAKAASYLKNLMLDKEGVEDMMKTVGFDQDGDGLISREEFNNTFNEDTFNLLVSYLDRLVGSSPQYKTRHSENAFLESAEFPEYLEWMEEIERRVHTVTKLPYEILKISENLQVVRYEEKGHYHCHLDSEDIGEEDVPCCHYLASDGVDCLTCRYVTLFYILREPDEGGETAFLMADNATFDEADLMSEYKHKCDLSKFCHKANLVYKPKRGSAIMWYNHFVDEKTGWMGSIDRMSTHGGCDVIKGVKWAANTWINVGFDKEQDLQTWRELLWENPDPFI